MHKKVGRPVTPKDKARAPGISVRLTSQEATAINDAVSRSGITSKSDWARKSLLYVALNGIRIT
jgi:hypothetical protein